MSKHYVYLFEDEFANILYVGKTSQNFDKRMQQHLSGKSSLNNECLNKLKRIRYIEYDHLCDAAMMEIYLMNYYKAPYNYSDNENTTGIYNLPIPDKESWKNYALKKDDSTIDINIINKLKQVFDSDIILNEDLENFINSKLGKELSEQDLNNLYAICNIKKNDFSELKEYIIKHNNKIDLTKDDNGVKLKKLSTGYRGYGTWYYHKDKLRYKFSYKNLQKTFDGINKKDVCSKVDSFLNYGISWVCPIGLM